jgi:Xaa-Pro aminopeptidase
MLGFRTCADQFALILYDHRCNGRSTGAPVTSMQEGMVLSVDIPVFNGSWGGLRVEDGFLVTADGAERLDDAPYAISV